MNILFNIYGKVKKELDILYELNEAEFKIAKTLINQIEKNQALINSEDGCIMLCFEKNKYWCEVNGYTIDKSKQINTFLNGAITLEYGEFIDSITYYGNRVMLYIVGSAYVEVFYDQNENEIINVNRLEPTSPRLALYSKNVDLKI
jgi:hypothetical protein